MGVRRERWRWLLLAIPFAVVAAAPRVALDELATVAATPLSGAATELEAALPEPAAPPEPLPPTSQAAEIAALDGEPVDDAGGDQPAVARPSGSPTKAGSPPPRGVMVNRARVLAAAKAGMRPSGGAVPATNWRPSGLALVGVNPIGVGLRDGDVVTRVGGTRATSQGAVIGAVTSALRQELPAITGEVWRGRQKILVTVELPPVQFEDEVQLEDSESDSPLPAR